MPVVLALIHHKPARKGEERSIDRSPSEEDSKVEPNSGMESEKNLSTALDDVVKWPRVAVVEESRLNVDVVECCRDVCDNPLMYALAH